VIALSGAATTKKQPEPLFGAGLPFAVLAGLPNTGSTEEAELTELLVTDGVGLGLGLGDVVADTGAGGVVVGGATGAALDGVGAGTDETWDTCET
jgi:hypothetical protein